jgi:nucleoside recognition membrane protein YjiH
MQEMMDVVTIALSNSPRTTVNLVENIKWKMPISMENVTIAVHTLNSDIAEHADVHMHETLTMMEIVMFVLPNCSYTIAKSATFIQPLILCQTAVAIHVIHLGPDGRCVNKYTL